MPRRRRMKLPPRIALPASELESKIMAMLRGLKECAKLKCVGFVHVRQLRAGAELRFRLASQRLADERSLLLSPRCVRSSTSSFHSGLSRSARLTTRTIPVNNAGSAQASKLAAMWWAPYPLRLLGLVRTLPSVPRASHYGGSPVATGSSLGLRVGEAHRE